MSIPLHLFGTSPSGISFTPEFPLTDKYWEETPASFETLKCPRTVNSLPKEDIAKITQDDFDQLKFILVNSNIREEFYYEEGPQIFTNSSHFRGEKTGPSYNVFLRILAALSTSGKPWFGIVPDTRSSQVWKWPRGLPQDEDVMPYKHPELANKLAEPEDTFVFLEELQKTFPRTHEFAGTLMIFNRIAIRVLDQEYILPANLPFVCCNITDEDLHSNGYCAPEIIANPAFLTLLQTEPAKANELYLEALADLFHYTPQDEDCRYTDWDTFINNHTPEISHLVHPETARLTTALTSTKEIHQAARNILASHLPEYREILENPQPDGQNSVKIQSLTFNQDGFTIDAILQTKNQKYSIKFRNNHCSSTPLAA